MPPSEAAAVVLVDRAISVLSIIIFGSIAYVLSDKTKVAPDGHADANRVANVKRPGDCPSVFVTWSAAR